MIWCEKQLMKSQYHQSAALVFVCIAYLEVIIITQFQKWLV